MSGKKRGPQGPTQGNAARGFDAAYGEQIADARRELAETLAGPEGQQPVQANHTGLKNPDGEFGAPAPRKPGPPPGKPKRGVP